MQSEIVICDINRARNYLIDIIFHTYTRKMQNKLFHKKKFI